MIVTHLYSKLLSCLDLLLGFLTFPVNFLKFSMNFLTSFLIALGFKESQESVSFLHKNESFVEDSARFCLRRYIAPKAYVSFHWCKDIVKDVPSTTQTIYQTLYEHLYFFKLAGLEARYLE